MTRIYLSERINKMDYKVYKPFVDILILIAVVLPSICLKALETPELPFQRGFYCNDESIRYPYHEDTISVAVLLAVGLLVPIATMFICEWLNYSHFSKRDEQSSWKPYVRKKFCGRSIHPWVAALYTTIGPFALGAAFTLLLTDSGKFLIGRLRPHFIAICKPDWSAINCTNMQGFMQYVQNIPCMGTDNEKLTNARLSFPSGHSSSAFYLFIYWMIYMQARMIPECVGETVLKPFLQMLGFLAAMMISLSRISDYKHHWSDVLAGSALGLVVAVLVAYYVSDLYTNVVMQQAKAQRNDDERLRRGEPVAIYGSGSVLSEQMSNDSKDHAGNNVATAVA